MCLSIPSQVVDINAGEQLATVDTLGIRQQVSTHLMAEPLNVGDYVLIHIGFVMDKINCAEAESSLAQYRQLVQKLDDTESPC